MRAVFSVIFILLIIALGVCAAVARRSRKAIGLSVSLLVAALIPPVTGNLVIVSSSVRLISQIGCYIYFLGMDLVVFALLKFTFDYCHISWPSRGLKGLVYLLLGSDAVQLLCNPFFHHAFGIEAIPVDGRSYYRLVPYLGQAFHRVVCYGVFAAALVIFLVKLIRAPRIYSERYSVLFFSMVAAGLWQTFYIFSRSPIDRSMLGFGVFGLLVFYFSLYYRSMRLLDQMLANIASQMPEALFFFDAGGQCIWANRLGMELTDVRAGHFDQAKLRLAEAFGELSREGNEWSCAKVLGEGDDSKYYILEKRAVQDARGRVSGSFLSVRDNTEEQLALQREKYSATHDKLTGLYNRDYLYERIHAALLANPDIRYDIVFVDIKDFKVVNDTFGSDFGDYALQQVAEWVASILPENCVYGRLAGDTFGVCVPADQFDPRRLEKALDHFIVRNGAMEHQILMHLGVYEVAEPDLEVSVMFDRAHLALSTIENEYQIHIAYYDDDMRQRVLWGQRITAQLQTALTDGELRPYLQPIVDGTGRVVGAEALVRWNYPVDNLLSPAMFMPIFEKNGMIAEVDKFMWRSACEILARWKAEGRNDLFISVNISPKDFFFMDVAAEIKGIAREYDIDPSLLRLEITETVMMTDIDKRIGILKELKSSGFIVEMDDFGSGYSSLNLLKDMPVDVIKIDMLFLSRAKDDRAETIMRNVIHLSEELGLVTISEGVETPEQYQMLSVMGCRLFQGFNFAKPMPVDQFEEQYLAMAG